MSNHVWSKEINIPENIEISTIEAKLKENQLKVTGKMKKIEKVEEMQIEVDIE